MTPPNENMAAEFDEPDDSVAYDFMARVQPGTPEFDKVKALIDEGLADIERGDVSPLNFDEIRRLGREKLAQYRQEQSRS